MFRARSGQGAINGSVALGACFATMHDVTAHRTMPRFVWCGSGSGGGRLRPARAR
jgi:hypothetical protein